jgi:histidinol dehydrogenase
MDIARLDSRDADFDAQLAALLDRAPEQDPQLMQTVAGIVDDVRRRGDEALLDYTRRFDRHEPADAATLRIDMADCQAALASLAPALREALMAAAERIRAYAQRQGLRAWEFEDDTGTRLGQLVNAMDRVGIYVPGGKAAYPSSVLMNAIPAKVAGVADVVMVVPTPGGQSNPVVLAAAAIAGVDRIFRVGGAQAIAALAYGTHTVPAVDKIVGPGNAYVAAAKRLVFGRVGIDSIAGPSEIVVIADGGSDPRWLAMDLFSQAEHGEDSQSVLITADAGLLDAVARAMDERLAELPRAAIVRESIAARGALILVRDLDEAVDVANLMAPEHLELAVDAPRALLPRVRHAGAVFLGRHTPEALGDYCAGPNHVLPTSRAARYASPLGVYEFQKRSSLIECTARSAAQLSRIAGPIADAEGLQAHAASARDRS